MKKTNDNPKTVIPGPKSQKIIKLREKNMYTGRV